MNNTMLTSKEKVSWLGEICCSFSKESKSIMGPSEEKKPFTETNSS